MNARLIGCQQFACFGSLFLDINTKIILTYLPLGLCLIAIAFPMTWNIKRSFPSAIDWFFGSGLLFVEFTAQNYRRNQFNFYLLKSFWNNLKCWMRYAPIWMNRSDFFDYSLLLSQLWFVSTINKWLVYKYEYIWPNDPSAIIFEMRLIAINGRNVQTNLDSGNLFE